MRVAKQLRDARWFRATDIPSAKPSNFAWKPPRKPSKFEPFAKEDSNRIERAFQKGIPTVPVESDGLREVNVKRRLAMPTFWEGDSWEVRRGTWFLLESNRIVPIKEAHATSLDHARDAGGKKVALDSGINAEFDSPGGDTAIIKGPTWMSALKQFQVPKEQKLVRGFSRACKEFEIKKDIPELPPYHKREFDNLVLCVHGIGQLISAKFDFVNFAKDVSEFQDALDKAMKSTDPKGNSGIQALPICWRQELPHDVNADSFDVSLRTLKPQALFGQENVLADIVLDFIMYMQPHYRDAILATAAKLMNETVRKFSEQNGFQGKISILGHSLGGVIVNDLVRTDLLEFDLADVFLVGSPVGVLQLLQGRPFTKPKNIRGIYNIMHLGDPVATRLEPLVSRDAVDTMPLTIPNVSGKVLSQLKELTDQLTARGAAVTFSASKIIDSLKQLASYDAPQESDAAQRSHEAKDKAPPHSHHSMDALKDFNRHGRLDFKISETVDIPWILGLAYHLMYLDNEDIATFILHELKKK